MNRQIMLLGLRHLNIGGIGVGIVEVGDLNIHGSDLAHFVKDMGYFHFEIMSHIERPMCPIENVNGALHFKGNPWVQLMVNGNKEITQKYQHIEAGMCSGADWNDMRSWAQFKQLMGISVNDYYALGENAEDYLPKDVLQEYLKMTSFIEMVNESGVLKDSLHLFAQRYPGLEVEDMVGVVGLTPEEEILDLGEMHYKYKNPELITAHLDLEMYSPVNRCVQPIVLKKGSSVFLSNNWVSKIFKESEHFQHVMKSVKYFNKNEAVYLEETHDGCKVEVVVKDHGGWGRGQLEQLLGSVTKDWVGKYQNNSRHWKYCASINLYGFDYQERVFDKLNT